jgi:hypothetical protein
MYRGWLVLDGVELTNSARVVAHLDATLPLDDSVFGGAAPDCTLVETAPGSGLYVVPDDVIEVAPGLYSEPNGSRVLTPGLLTVGPECWDEGNLCGRCRSTVNYDDSWTGLQDWLGHITYRPELAPWATTTVPESMEFGGVWLMDAKGFDAAPVSRPVNEMAGAGAAAGVHRDSSRMLTFDALLIACTNAGLSYGVEWLSCQLRETKARTDATLRYLSAHPGYSDADPDTLVRELHNVVLTKALNIEEEILPGGQQNRQATMYRVSWEMVALHPYAYTPPDYLSVEWDLEEATPINWIHAAECSTPEHCDPMPVMFSTECEPETIDVVTTPPPTCGGCMPVCEVTSRVFDVPTNVSPLLCNETAVSMTVRSTGNRPVSLQLYWQESDSDQACGNLWPAQISGLPAGATLTLDAVSGRAWAEIGSTRYQPIGVVSTPTGSPWLPPVIDRSKTWQLVALSSADAQFEVALKFADRQA